MTGTIELSYCLHVGAEQTYKNNFQYVVVDEMIICSLVTAEYVSQFENKICFLMHPNGLEDVT